MSRRHTHTVLAFILLSTAACSDDAESSETNAQSADSGTDASVDAGAEKPAAGRGGSAAAGRAGRGGAPAGGKGGAGGARDAGAEEADEEDKKDEDEKEEENEGGKGGSAPDEAGGAGGTAGNATAGSGGTAGNATAGASGAAGTTAADDDAGVADPQGPHLKTATLQGHLWLAFSGAGTTLTATGYDTPVVSGPVCIQGSVAATPDYNSNAAIGLNLNQLPNEVPMPFTPTLAGLQVDVANRTGSPLRILIQTQDGSGLWCANVNGAGGFIAWTDFNTACWDGSGTAYALQPLAVASVQVPGGIDAAIPYDFCLNGLTETAAPAAPTTPAP
jgi:hypothetical protein